MLGRLVLIVALGVLACAQTEPIDAQDLGNRDRAWVLYEQSQVLFRDGRFEEAAVLLRRAYALEPEPVLIYNLALALERSADAGGAREAYRRYLDVGEDDVLRGRASSALARLQEETPDVDTASATPAAERDDASEEPVVRTEAPPDTTTHAARSGGVDGWPFALAGVGALGFVASSICWAVANERDSQARSASSLLATRQLRDEAQALADGTTVLLVASSVLVTAALTWLLVQLLSTDSQPEDAPALAARW